MALFATSHGKSPCDGIGGKVKQLVTQSRFRNNHILSVDLMHDWYVNNIPGIIFIKITTDNVQNHITRFSLEESYSSANFMPEMYVACIYDDDWFVGHVIGISEQYNEIQVKFMKKNRKCLLWPTKDD